MVTLKTCPHSGLRKFVEYVKSALLLGGSGSGIEPARMQDWILSFTSLNLSIYNRHNLLQHLSRQFQFDWWGHHGIAHWARVRANGLMLANQTSANRHVVELFAFFHDSRRFNEHVDDGHGARGAALASSLKGRYFDATDEEMDLLHLASVHHSDGITQGNATVLTCWDADRLDLGRLGITPRAKYLGTEAARTAAVMAKANRRAQASCDVYDARHDSN